MTPCLTTLLLVLSIYLVLCDLATHVQAHSFPSNLFRLPQLRGSPHQRLDPRPDLPANLNQHLPCISNSLASAIFGNLTQATQRPDIQVYHRTEAIQWVLYEAAYLTSYDCALVLDLVTEISKSLQSQYENRRSNDAIHEGWRGREMVCGGQAQWARVQQRFDELRRQLDDIRQGIEDDHFSVNLLSHRANPALAAEFSQARKGNSLNQLADQRSHLIPIIDTVDILLSLAAEESAVYTNTLRSVCSSLAKTVSSTDGEHTASEYLETMEAYFPVYSIL